MGYVGSQEGTCFFFTWPHFKEYATGPLHGQLMPITDCSYIVKPVIQGLSEPRQRFLIAYKCLGYQRTDPYFFGIGSKSKEGQRHFC